MLRPPHPAIDGDAATCRASLFAGKLYHKYCTCQQQQRQQELYSKINHMNVMKKNQNRPMANQAHKRVQALADISRSALSCYVVVS